MSRNRASLSIVEIPAFTHHPAQPVERGCHSQRVPLCIRCLHSSRKAS
ncbi:Hypothetical protein AA314_04695 [Archangium gephyra]|uniref:Uncharacterized protein n=1 Tax=Archangium gephyra TaxID=48 RepID=A0AAC8Q918_9BACT|nr:Hypothetical protein AA314_04695 [Archangium gephyra]